MGIKHMTGSPWHKERVCRQEGDERRHKSHCVYFKWDSNRCILGGGCLGSAHCSKYKKMSAEEEAAVKKQKASAASSSRSDDKDDDDGVYWY